MKTMDFVSLVLGIVGIVVCMINNYCRRKSADKQHQATIEAAEKQHNTTMTLIEYKLDQPTKKVELHSNAVEQLFLVEKTINVQKEQIEAANHRIEDLEHEMAGRVIPGHSIYF